MKRTGAVIAAAGLSSRMGAFKPLLPFGEFSVAGHLVAMLKAEHADPIVVVTGFRGEELERELADSGVLLIRNEHYETSEMMDSLRLGFGAIAELCDQILVMPVDVPAVTGATVRRVMECDSPIVRTKSMDRYGHPVKLDREMVKLAMAYQGDDGLRGFLKGQKELVRDVVVYDEGSFTDADTREEYRRLLALNGSRGKGYLDGEALKWLLQTSGMPETVRRHSEAVSRKALDMAVRLSCFGICLNLELVRSAALLHDIGKGQPDHARRGAEILRRSGYPLAAEIVRQHHDLDCIPQQADETLVVYLADKLVQGEREVSLEERFERSRVKCAGSREAMEHFERRRLQARRALQVWESSIAI